MHTYRRFASTASSTSRSASTSMSHHSHGHPTTTTMSRSTSTAAEPRGGLSITMPSSAITRGLGSPSSTTTTTTRSPTTPYGTLSSSNLNISPEYTSSDLHTIAESLLAHVTFGPYHIASSPVPSSHMHTLLAASQSSRNKENALANGGSTSSSTASILGPSSRRQFEGKEGSHRPSSTLANVVTYPPIPPLVPFGASGTSSSASTPRSNQPRARFTIGPPESERGRGAGGDGMRGRGLGRKSVTVGGISLSRREPSSHELWELDEEDRDRGRVGARGRRGDVKVLRVEQ